MGALKDQWPPHWPPLGMRQSCRCRVWAGGDGRPACTCLCMAVFVSMFVCTYVRLSQDSTHRCGAFAWGCGGDIPYTYLRYNNHAQIKKPNLKTAAGAWLAGWRP